MKRAKPVALIASGKLTGLPVTALLRLWAQLGPVMAPSYRLASRIANSFRAGHPVKDYAEFDACRLILVLVPDQVLPKVIAGMLSAAVCWRGKAVVLCSSRLDSSELSAFSAHGASIGSLSPIPGFEDSRYLIEGDPLALRESKQLVEHRHERVVPIERALKPLYLASLTCTGSLLFALLAAASECLRQAGVPSSLATTLLDKQVGKTLRSYLKAGRKAYPPPQELSKQVSALMATDPELAQYLEQSSCLAEHLMEKG